MTAGWTISSSSPPPRGIASIHAWIIRPFWYVRRPHHCVYRMKSIYILWFVYLHHWYEPVEVYVHWFSLWNGNQTLWETTRSRTQARTVAPLCCSFLFVFVCVCVVRRRRRHFIIIYACSSRLILLVDCHRGTIQAKHVWLIHACARVSTQCECHSRGRSVAERKNYSTIEWYDESSLFLFAY